MGGLEEGSCEFEILVGLVTGPEDLNLSSDFLGPIVSLIWYGI